MLSLLFQSLLLLTYLVRNGSERVVTSAREHLYDLRGLENYTFTDEFGKDQGLNGNCTEKSFSWFHFQFCTGKSALQQICFCVFTVLLYIFSSSKM